METSVYLKNINGTDKLQLSNVTQSILFNDKLCFDIKLDSESIFDSRVIIGTYDNYHIYLYYRNGKKSFFNGFFSITKDYNNLKIKVTDENNTLEEYYIEKINEENEELCIECHLPIDNINKLVCEKCHKVCHLKCTKILFIPDNWLCNNCNFDK